MATSSFPTLHAIDLSMSSPRRVIVTARGQVIVEGRSSTTAVRLLGQAVTGDDDAHTPSGARIVASHGINCPRRIGEETRLTALVQDAPDVIVRVAPVDVLCDSDVEYIEKNGEAALAMTKTKTTVEWCVEIVHLGHPHRVIFRIQPPTAVHGQRVVGIAASRMPRNGGSGRGSQVSAAAPAAGGMKDDAAVSPPVADAYYIAVVYDSGMLIVWFGEDYGPASGKHNWTVLGSSSLPSSPTATSGPALLLPSSSSTTIPASRITMCGAHKLPSSMIKRIAEGLAFLRTSTAAPEQGRSPPPPVINVVPMVIYRNLIQLVDGATFITLELPSVRSHHGAAAMDAVIASRVRGGAAAVAALPLPVEEDSRLNTPEGLIESLGKRMKVVSALGHKEMTRLIVGDDGLLFGSSDRPKVVHTVEMAPRTFAPTFRGHMRRFANVSSGTACLVASNAGLGFPLGPVNDLVATVDVQVDAKSCPSLNVFSRFAQEKSVLAVANHLVFIPLFDWMAKFPAATTEPQTITSLTFLEIDLCRQLAEQQNKTTSPEAATAVVAVEGESTPSPLLLISSTSSVLLVSVDRNAAGAITLRPVRAWHLQASPVAPELFV